MEVPPCAHALPSLSNLSLNPRRALLPDAPTGLYCLDRAESTQPCESSVILIRNAIRARPEDVQKLDDFMSDPSRVAVTPNKLGGFERDQYGNFVKPDGCTPTWKVHRDCKTGQLRVWKSAVLRRQATFGPQYDFGQVNTAIENRAEWPDLVTQCLEYAQQLAEQKGFDRNLYNGVHVNLYESGRAGVQAHSDSEPAIVAGMPIFSFTFLNGDRQPRSFSIYYAPPYKGARPQKVTDVLLGDGDLLIMQGNMQRSFWHGVEPTGAKCFQNARRLNLTVRAFQPVQKRKACADS